MRKTGKGITVHRTYIQAKYNHIYTSELFKNVNRKKTVRLNSQARPSSMKN